MRSLFVLLLSIAVGFAHHPTSSCSPPIAVTGGDKYCELAAPGCTDASCASGGVYTLAKSDDGHFTLACMISNYYGAPLPPMGPTSPSFNPNPNDSAELWVTIRAIPAYGVHACGSGFLDKAVCESQAMMYEALALAPERFAMGSTTEPLLAPCPRPNIGTGPYTMEEYDAYVMPFIMPRPPPFPPPMPPLPDCACDIYSNGASMGMEYMCLSIGKYAPKDKAVCTPTRPGFPGTNSNGGHYDFFCDQSKTLCMGQK